MDKTLLTTRKSVQLNVAKGRKKNRKKYMYIWLGIDVDEQLTDIKSKAIKVENELGFLNSNFTIPLHISLKISFFVEDKISKNVVKDVVKLFQKYESFFIDINQIEFCNTICWILMKKNATLNKIHDELNFLLLERYGVKLHEYDLDYKFHTTLFMDSDSKKVAEAYRKIKNTNIPKQLLANKFLICSSPNGNLGTYHIDKEIILSTKQ